MKKYLLYIGCALTMTFVSGCDDFLDKEPLDKPLNTSYWKDETTLRPYAQEFYGTFFVGYAQDYRAFGGFFSGDSYNDDLLLTSDNATDINQRFFFPMSATTGINSVSTVWTKQYEMVRKANVMLEKIPGMDLSDAAKLHWTGVARFFRALAYHELVKTYGGVPYVDKAPEYDDSDYLYKERDERLYVVNKMLEDFNYALANVRENDGTLQVNRFLVGGLMSRSMLYQATWLKYHGTTVGTSSKQVPDTDLSPLFQGVIDGAEVVMNSGKYAIGNTYNALFSSESLAGNPEVIFYREYAYGVLANALMAYNAKEPQILGGPTADAINSYLCSDGLPISQSSLYQGNTDPSIENAFVNRDPRMYDTFVDSLRIRDSGLHSAASYTGYVTKKFLNEDWLLNSSPYITGLNSPADAPIIRYAEVLLNYVEARYEISKIGGAAFSQDDLNKSINQIRKRVLTKWGEANPVARTMPAVTLSGNSLVVNGVAINDPDRDLDVDPVLWEIRRERRVELMLEGRRSDDLNRWAKFEYLNTGSAGSPNKTSLGAWINKDDYPGIKDVIKLYDPSNPGAGTKGYINYYYDAGSKTKAREFVKGELDSERMYLRSIPASQITLYKDKGYTLEQNPGW